MAANAVCFIVVPAAGGLPSSEKGRREARHGRELGQLLRAEPGLACGHDIAFTGVPDRGRQQLGERQPPAMSLRHVERQRPARDRPGHGECRKRAARRNRFEIAVELAPGVGTGAARRHQRAHAAIWFTHEPEAVTTDVVHVRIDRRDGCGHRHHGLERIAAFGQNGSPGLGSRMMRCANDAQTVSGGVEVHDPGRRNRSGRAIAAPGVTIWQEADAPATSVRRCCRCPGLGCAGSNLPRCQRRKPAQAEIKERPIDGILDRRRRAVIW